MSASPLGVQQMLFCRLTGPQKIEYEQKNKKERKKIKEQKDLELMGWGFFCIGRVARGKKKRDLPKLSIGH